MIQIGRKFIENDTVFFELEYNGQGFHYKNEEAFLNSPDEICYIPEYGIEEGTVADKDSVTGYSRNAFLDICEGDEKLCRELFYSVDWQHPETLFDEWCRHGEV